MRGLQVSELQAGGGQCRVVLPQGWSSGWPLGEVLELRWVRRCHIWGDGPAVTYAMEGSQVLSTGESERQVRKGGGQE